jgi:hypothetical protein
MGEHTRTELDRLTQALGYRWDHGSHGSVIVLVDYMEWTGMGSEPETAWVMDLPLDKALVALRALAGEKQRAVAPPEVTEAEAQWIADALWMSSGSRHDVRMVVNMVLAARAT